MKIVFCLNHFLPQHTAGTEVYVWALSKQLAKKGHEVLILIPNFEATHTIEYLYDGLKIIKYAEPSIVNRALIFGERKPDGLQNFIEVLKNYKPDIIHFHVIGGSNGIGISHLKAVNSMNCPIVTTFHLAGYSCFTNNLMFKNSQRCDGIINIKKCSSCVLNNKGLSGVKLSLVSTISNAMYFVGYNSLKWNKSIGTALAHPFLINSFKNKLENIVSLNSRVVILTNWYYDVLIKNGLLPIKLKLIKQGLPSNNANFEIKEKSSVIQFVFVGRIVESKGLHLILEAMKLISNKSFSLSIYGPALDNDYLNFCKNLAKNLNVYWLGVLSPKELINNLSKFDCLVLPSIICEMSPLVIQEAFAAKVPILASNIYGNSEQIENGKTGWLFEVNNYKDLKDKMQFILENPFLIENAKNHIKPPKDFEKIAEEHVDLYNEIMQLT